MCMPARSMLPRLLAASGLTLASLALSSSRLHAEPRYFGGYPCTDRCRDHAAGFEYARQLRLKDPTQCAGPTLSYVQGCRVYSRDRMRDGTKDDGGRRID